MRSRKISFLASKNRVACFQISQLPASPSVSIWSVKQLNSPSPAVATGFVYALAAQIPKENGTSSCFPCFGENRHDFTAKKKIPDLFSPLCFFSPSFTALFMCLRKKKSCTHIFKMCCITQLHTFRRLTAALWGTAWRPKIQKSII